MKQKPGHSKVAKPRAVEMTLATMRGEKLLRDAALMAGVMIVGIV
jgi:hypothetical protein